MIVIIDGPEKVGKSTLIAQLVKTLDSRGTQSRVRKWGQVFPDDRVYLEPLKQDSKDKDIVSIWDRSWASEYVYGKLLERDRRLAIDPWLGEWLYGRACDVKVMLTAEIEQLRARRDETDLPVDPANEMVEYQNYAIQFGWETMSTRYSKTYLDDAVNRIIEMLSTSKPMIDVAPIYAGPREPIVIFVGEIRSANPQMVGSWLPFTSRYTTELARNLGQWAMQCGWTNAHEIAPQKLRGAEVIVSCGKIASDWVKNYVITSNKIMHLIIPHPSWLYRYNNENTLRERKLVESTMKILAKWLEEKSDIDYLVKFTGDRKIFR